MKISGFLLSLLFLSLLLASTACGAARPCELGKVPWLRDYDAALARARETHRPILLLFSEVPG